MIVLTKEQKDLFFQIKVKYQEELLLKGIDFIPIEIKGNLWILPNEILSDERFNIIKQELKDIKEFDKYTIREINSIELFESVK